LKKRTKKLSSLERVVAGEARAQTDRILFASFYSEKEDS
jgi:hypothetical protein